MASTQPPTTPPTKQREVQNAFMDSTRWNAFPWRDDDIVICSYAKSGTTWTKQIARQLILRGAAPEDMGLDSPWVEFRVEPLEDSLAVHSSRHHRRFLQTHLPLDATVWRPENRYIYVGRDGRDVLWSFVHHLAEMHDAAYDAINGHPGRVGPAFRRPSSGDPYEQFRELVDGEEGEEGGGNVAGLPWPFWSHVRGWYAARQQPNLLLVHFADLKKDLPGEMRRIAEFLGEGTAADMSEGQWADAVEHCTFDWMKANAARVIGPMGQMFKGGAGDFINKGTNGRWRDRLSEDDVARYRARAEKELGVECARWLEHGRLG